MPIDPISINESITCLEKKESFESRYTHVFFSFELVSVFFKFVVLPEII